MNMHARRHMGNAGDGEARFRSSEVAARLQPAGFFFYVRHKSHGKVRPHFVSWAPTTRYAIIVVVGDCQNPRFHNASVAALGEARKSYDFYLKLKNT